MGFRGRLSIRPVQPRSAVKPYLCPGCRRIIPAGRFHLVIVPEEDPDLRRHWHHGCWYKEQRRVRGKRKASGNPSVPLHVDSVGAHYDRHQIHAPDPD